MAVLFFALDQDLNGASKSVFKAINSFAPIEGESSNVLNSVYTQVCVLGLRIKLEANSYDYEERYNYMVSVTQDFLADNQANEHAAEALADAVAFLLKKNLAIEIAREKDDELVIV